MSPSSGPSVDAFALWPIPTQPSMEFHMSPSARAGPAATKAASATPPVTATRLRVLRESKGKARLLRRCRQSLIIPQFTAICWQAGLFGHICPGLFGQPFENQQTHPDADRHVCEIEYIPRKAADMKVIKISNISIGQPVGGIADRAADDQSQTKAG